ARIRSAHGDAKWTADRRTDTDGGHGEQGSDVGGAGRRLWRAGLVGKPDFRSGRQGDRAVIWWRARVERKDHLRGAGVRRLGLSAEPQSSAVDPILRYSPWQVGAP